MESKNDRKPTDPPTPAESPQPTAPKKRFRIEKVEERIAPKKKYTSSASSGFSGDSGPSSVF